MPRKQRSGMSPDWDKDLKKSRKTMQAAEAMQTRNARQARADSNSPTKGMDGVDYEGTNRWNYNISRAKAAMARLKIGEIDAQQQTRDQSRADYSKRISRRMKK